MTTAPHSIVKITFDDLTNDYRVPGLEGTEDGVYAYYTECPIDAVDTAFHIHGPDVEVRLPLSTSRGSQLESSVMSVTPAIWRSTSPRTSGSIETKRWLHS
jgi:hypothetical protein